jgi:hypothetical protein
LTLGAAVNGLPMPCRFWEIVAHSKSHLWGCFQKQSIHIYMPPPVPSPFGSPNWQKQLAWTLSILLEVQYLYLALANFSTCLNSSGDPSKSKSITRSPKQRHAWCQQKVLDYYIVNSTTYCSFSGWFHCSWLVAIVVYLACWQVTSHKSHSCPARYYTAAVSRNSNNEQLDFHLINLWIYSIGPLWLNDLLDLRFHVEEPYVVLSRWHKTLT